MHNLLEELTVDCELVLDEERTGATWYKFKTDRPPQYSLLLAAQTMLHGFGLVTVFVLTDPELMTFPQ